MSDLSGINAARLRPEQLLAKKNDPATIKAAAQEMESLFLYELIKTMRESTQLSPKQQFGNSAYTSMFDQELARVMSKRGIGLAEMLQRSMKLANTHLKGVDEAHQEATAGKNSPIPAGK